MRVMRSSATRWVRGLFLLFLLTASAAQFSSQAVAQNIPSRNVESLTAMSPGREPLPETSMGPAMVRIGGGDMLELNVFDIPEMTQTIRVDDIGDASFSLIGSLHLAGLTTDQARDLITRKLQDGNFILHPQVSVLIREYGTQGVSVLGEVRKPGVYRILGSRTLLDILSEAGGTTSIAGTSATIKRNADGSTLTIPLTKNAQASLASDVRLQPGDKVLVPRASLVYVIGDVNRAGGFIMENDGRITALQAVALAGGNTRTAALNRAVLVRKTGATYSEVGIDLQKILHGHKPDTELQAEDVLYIPNSTVKSVVYHGVPNILQAAANAAVYANIP